LEGGISILQDSPPATQLAITSSTTRVRTTRRSHSDVRRAHNMMNSPFPSFLPSTNRRSPARPQVTEVSGEALEQQSTVHADRLPAAFGRPAPVLRQASEQTVDRDCSAATAHPMGWLSGFPTGRLWVSLSRVLFLGSLRSCTPLPECPNFAGPDTPEIGGLSPRGQAYHLRRR
jgi:hypothetical protein